MKLIGTIFTLIAIAASHAASITHTTTIFPSRTDWSVTNSVPQFDAALGTLTNVIIGINVNANTEVFVENRDRRAWATTVGSTVTATATVAGFSAITSFTNSHTQTLTSFDGLLDFGGTSGFTQSVSGSDSASTSVPFAPFVGVGNVPLIASTLAVGNYQGSGFYEFGVLTTASALVTVTYEFSPPTCPECDPEPDCERDRRKPRNKRR
jgi:hypothetical protein